jgi:hypothetical protein
VKHALLDAVFREGLRVSLQPNFSQPDFNVHPDLPFQLPSQGTTVAEDAIEYSIFEGPLKVNHGLRRLPSVSSAFGGRAEVDFGWLEVCW